MKKEFIVERQGKTFVLYAGLLDLAHEQGMTGITTSIVQLPSEANKFTAVCTATISLEKDGKGTTFTGIGDAAPNNVAPAMQTCLIRMAETRAKARALRDAVNVGAAALEELGEGNVGNDADDFRPPSRAASRAVRAAGPRTAAGPNRTAAAPTAATGEITDAQRNAIITLCNRKNQSPPDMEGWTEQEAGEYLKKLQKAA